MTATILKFESSTDKLLRKMVEEWDKAVAERTVAEHEEGLYHCNKARCALDDYSKMCQSPDITDAGIYLSMAETELEHAERHGADTAELRERLHSYQQEITG